jgi:cytidylate kinase
MPDKKITIAIDGYSSCGKSTLARQLAEKLGYTFIDSGAMYRAVTLYSINHGIILNSEVNEEKLLKRLDEITISFKINPDSGINEINLNGEFVENEIRKPHVASFVSKIARIKEVREKLVETQREIGKNGGIVMDGRDIGSVVFPNAELKIFVTASTSVRVERRHKELSEKGIQTTKQAVKDNLLQRDLIDTTRKESPLIQVEDAKVIDNTNLTREEQLALALEYAEELIKNHSIQ